MTVIRYSARRDEQKAFDLGRAARARLEVSSPSIDMDWLAMLDSRPTMRNERLKIAWFAGYDHVPPNVRTADPEAISDPHSMKEILAPEGQ